MAENDGFARSRAIHGTPESESGVTNRERFMREYMGEWPAQQKQCAHHSLLERCQNVAEFGVVRGDGEVEPVCAPCLPEACRRALKRYENVVIVGVSRA